MLRYFAFIASALILAAVASAPVMAALPSTESTTPLQVVVKDSFGDEFTPQRYARIVTLAPNLTEIVHFLGEFDRIVGITSYDNYPPEVSELPKVGGYVNPGVESIVVLKPDLVLAFRGNPLPVIRKLKEMGITVFVLDSPSSLREILQQVEDVGKLIQADEPALKRVKALREKLDSREKSLKLGQPRPRVMMLACCLTPPFYAAGRETFIDDLIRLAGGENAFVGKGFALISPEEFLAANPEYLLLPVPSEDADYGDKILRELKRYPYIAQTAAVREERIILIHEDVLTRPSPRIFEALEQLSNHLEGDS